MNWDDFDAFCHVVREGGFTAAARTLQWPKSRVSAAVARLEAALDSRLLERTIRTEGLAPATRIARTPQVTAAPFGAGAERSGGFGAEGRAGSLPLPGLPPFSITILLVAAETGDP